MSEYRDLGPFFRDYPDARLKGALLGLWDAIVIALRLPQIVDWLVTHWPFNTPTDRKEQA